MRELPRLLSIIVCLLCVALQVHGDTQDLFQRTVKSRLVRMRGIENPQDLFFGLKQVPTHVSREIARDYPEACRTLMILDRDFFPQVRLIEQHALYHFSHAELSRLMEQIAAVRQALYRYIIF